MYTWGAGESGQLGHGEERNGHMPRLVDMLTDVVIGQVSFGGPSRRRDCHLMAPPLYLYQVFQQG